MEQEKTYRRSIPWICLAIAAVLLAADQITKYFVLRDLKPLHSMTILNGLLEFSYIENTGAAFGLFKNIIWFVFLVTAAAAVALLVILFRYRKHTFFSYAASTLLIAGGIGNLIDRIFYGFVVDFIHVMFFDYIFNFADCCVTVGVVLFVIHVLVLSAREKQQSDQAEPSSEQEK